MTEAVFQFKAIARKLNRQEQKAEFEEKNPPAPHGVVCPLVQPNFSGLFEKIYELYGQVKI